MFKGFLWVHARAWWCKIVKYDIQILEHPFYVNADESAAKIGWCESRAQFTEKKTNWLNHKSWKKILRKTFYTIEPNWSFS